MQAVDVCHGAARAAKGIGRATKGAVGRVNPDVWRELGFVCANAYSLVLPRREPVADRGRAGDRPIVLVHGLGANRGTWTPMRWFLRLHGRRRVYAFGYEDGTVPEIAGRLSAFIDEVCAATGEREVDVVCHSLGGIVARYAVQRLGKDGAVRLLVTLATPHRGTYVANWANTGLTRALRADSELIADLNADDWSAHATRLVTVSSDRDVYVVPREHMTHPAAENLFVPGLAHTEHLMSPAVFRVVLRTLGEAADMSAAPEPA